MASPASAATGGSPCNDAKIAPTAMPISTFQIVNLSIVHTSVSFDDPIGGAIRKLRRRYINPGI